MAVYQSPWGSLGAWLLPPVLLAFLAVVWIHSRLEHRIQRLRVWRTIKTTNLARHQLDWDALPPFSGEPAFGGDRHFYAGDIDITGRYGLLRLIDTTASNMGQRRLAAWLLDQNDESLGLAPWLTRQGLIRELAALSLFRDRITLEAALVGKAEISGERIGQLLEQPVGFKGLLPALWVLGILSVMTAVLLTLTFVMPFPRYWLWSFLLYVIVYLSVLNNTSEVFSRALSLHGGFKTLTAVFRYVEKRRYPTTPILAELCAPFNQHALRPSEATKQVERICAALSIRGFGLAHIIVNALCPWDLWFTHRLEHWRGMVKPYLPNWLDRFATLDAASALATFASLHPLFQWPVLQEHMDADGGNGLIAQDLGHPLIKQAFRVSNDVAIRGLGHLVIVTGSNMSGKSSFLRTIGMNICLAQAGGPVCATSFRWSWVRLMCCIRVNDSLEEGISDLDAEVKRLKRIIDAVQDRTAPPVLFLIDEIFKGTNNRERLIGAQAFVKQLVRSNALGFISTHDLEMTRLKRKCQVLSMCTSVSPSNLDG